MNDRVESFESAVYKEPDSVFANVGNGTFRDMSQEAGLNEAKAHRGSAYADFDGDGKIDAVVSSLEAPVELWRNSSPDANHWLAVKLTGTHSNRDGVGARIRIGKQWNEMTSAVSYASSALDPVHFGLGSLTRVDTLQIFWPDGKQQTLHDLAIDQVLQVHEPN